MKNYCQCRGSCKIRHQLYNYRKPESDELRRKVENPDIESKSDDPRIQVITCDDCEQVFLNSKDFVLHMENKHKQADVNFFHW